MYIYLNSVIGKLFKILPLREAGDTNEFRLYVDGLWSEMSGALKLFPELWDDPRYLSILSILGFLCMNEVSVEKCRREVFQSINIVKQIRGAQDD